MSLRENLPNWVQERAKRDGPADREVRFEAAASALYAILVRNLPPMMEMDALNPRGQEQVGCPILVEGIRDREALVELGFKGPIETVNRGWSRERMVAWLHETYGTRNQIDGGAAIIILMDWDRTGGRLQRDFTCRLQAMDVKVSDDCFHVLLRTMKPETRCVEGLSSHSEALGILLREKDRKSARMKRDDNKHC